MKHLGIFSDSTAVQSALDSDELVKPYIVLTGQSGSRLVDYNTLTQKFEAPLTLTIDDITYPVKAVAYVEAPEMATGSIECIIGERTFTGELSNGLAIIDIPGLEVGEYTIDCYYEGDENYLPSNVSGSFNVLEQKFETPISLSISDVTYPDKGVVTVEVPEMATGSIECTVDGRTFTGEVHGGRARVDIIGLEPGNYTIDCYYPGDENYLPANDSVSFNVLEQTP